MLGSITWTQFIKCTGTLTAAWYVFIVFRFYRKEFLQLFKGRQFLLALLALLSIIGMEARVMAQTADGNNGLNQANTMVRGYFDTATQLMYAVGAILGLIGAIRVFERNQGGHADGGKLAAAWFGACIFLVLVATVIKAFFGL